jgi:two-component system CheB/CheR fusion protein
LLHSKEECETLSREFLIGVTQFFRDKEAFKILEDKVIPEIFKKAELNQPIRIWSVGSSTGEEAYSLAIICSEYMSANAIKADLKIFATDLGKEAIRIGGLGIYPQNIVADVPKHLLVKYFNNRNDNFQINENIRQMVVFANHNITTDPPFSKISLLVCRNLLIYFNNEMQQKVQSMFQYSLSQGGYMFLGSSESIIGPSDAFEVIDSKWKIFKYKDGYEHTSISGLIVPQTKLRNVVSELAVPIKNPYEKHNPLIELYEKALNHFAPAAVIIDENNTVMHLLKDVKRFLVFPEGRATLNILELANPQLTMVFSNMLFKARKEQKEITMSKFKFKEADKTLFLNISAKTISTKRKLNEFILLSIEEGKSIVKVQDANADVEFDFDEQAAERIRDLERELQYRDENLQTTIEELETSNEELQATNEEMVSSNEELQSTNEELQSVNEELYTVNSQYQEKITELTELNNDVNNLLSNTNIGTLFLDGKLIIRKFTPEIKRTINVMDVDIGRPFSHITYNTKYNKLFSIVNRVIETLIKEEVEVLANDGKWYLLKVQPYRHIDNSIHGILITQVNIDTLQKTRLTNLKLSEAIEQSTVGTLITDLHGNIEYVNEKYSSISGYSSSELIGKTPRILKSGYHDTFFYQNLWKTIQSGNVWDGKIRNMHKKGHLYWERAVIGPIKNESGEIINFLAIKEDITKQVENEKQLEYKKAVIENTEKIAEIGSWVFEIEENTLSWSDNTYKIFGVDKKTFIPSFDNFIEATHSDDRDMVSEAYKNATNKNKKYRIQHRIVRPSGEIRYVEVISKEIKNENNEVIRSIGVVKDLTDIIESANKLEQEHTIALKTQEELQLKTNALEQLNSQFSILVDTLPEAFAYHEIILDKTGKPVDYKFINVNKAFVKITGLSKETILGKTVKQILPDIEQEWIDNYGKVAFTGKTFDFEQYSTPLKETYTVHAYSPLKGFFAVIFSKKK